MCGAAPTQQVRVRRISDRPAPDDGRRVLVDGLWPRGVAKRDAAIDDWVRGVAPSGELRSWYGHDPARFPAFCSAYRLELAAGDRAEALQQLTSSARAGRLTLLTATRDVAHSHARVLEQELAERLQR